MRTFPQVGTPFVPGAELGRRFYAEAVRPLLDAEFPGLPHAAAHLGEGSDVLGYDTAMSRDHGWGPAVTLFLPEAEAGAGAGDPLDAGRPAAGPAFSPASPPTGRPAPGVRAGAAGAHDDRAGVRPPAARLGSGRPAVGRPTGCRSRASSCSSVTAGPVHHDGVGELTRLRERLAWYPTTSGATCSRPAGPGSARRST